LKNYKSVFGGLTVKILQAGEASGSLEQSLKRLSEEYDSKVDKGLKIITTVLEPAMLVTVALFVGGIMLAIIAPIYQMIGNITTR
jgi:type II secretory pathway component PulF